MIEISPWVLWSIITTPFLSGFGIGIWTSQFVSKKACKANRVEISEEQNRRFDEIIDERKEIWAKIDKMYEIVIERR